MGYRYRGEGGGWQDDADSTYSYPSFSSHHPCPLPFTGPTLVAIPCPLWPAQRHLGSTNKDIGVFSITRAFLGAPSQGAQLRSCVRIWAMGHHPSAVDALLTYHLLFISHVPKHWLRDEPAGP